MVKKLVVGLIALALCVGIALLLYENMRSSAMRLAETGRDLCYAQQGYDLVNSPSIPDTVVSTCGQSFRDYSAGETMRYVKAGAAGLVGGGLFLVLAWFLMFRRREPVGSAPPEA
jgi:hypothetical protein